MARGDGTGGGGDRVENGKRLKGDLGGEWKAGLSKESIVSVSGAHCSTCSTMADSWRRFISCHACCIVIYHVCYLPLKNIIIADCDWCG